jgi:hypothetical protein
MTNTTDPSIYVADEDIVVYKAIGIKAVATDSERSYHPYYRRDSRTYEVGGTYYEMAFEGPVGFPGQDDLPAGGLRKIEHGFHSLTSLEETEILVSLQSNHPMLVWNSGIAKCVIPRGALYSKGTFSFYSKDVKPLSRDLIISETFVSDAIRIIEIIKEP